MNQTQETILLSAKPQRQPDYRLESLDGELLLYHPGQTQILYCNQTASLIWQLCDGQHTVQEIIDLLSAAFPAAKDTIAADVMTTLSQFQQHGAIQ
ncbi:MAG: PqqD family protein [Anaerolineae bacterium]